MITIVILSVCVCACCTVQQFKLQWLLSALLPMAEHSTLYYWDLAYAISC